MIKKNGQKIASLAIAATIIGQNIQPIFAIENIKNQLSQPQQTIEIENSNDEVIKEDSTEIKEEVEEKEEINEVTPEIAEENNEVEKITKPDIKDLKNKTTIDFSVMATSDLHANLMNYDYYTGESTNNSGLVKIATLIKQYKAKVNKNKDNNKIDNTLVLDNGDTIEGTPLANVFAKKKPVKPGEQYPVYKALEEVGFDATTIGNHELNYGLDFIKQITKENKSMATVASNVTDAKTGAPIFDPYKIIEETVIDSNGEERKLKIGLTGVVPPQVMNWDALLLKGKINVSDMTESVKKYVPEMKSKGADIVVVLAHTGYGDENTPNEKNKENAGFDIANVDNVDVVIGGHVHKSFKTVVDKGIDKVQYIQPLNNGRELGLAELKINVEDTVDGKTIYKIDDDSSKINTVSTKGVENDAAIVSAVKSYHDETKNYVSTKSGEITKDLNSFFTLVADDASIQIVTDAQRKFVEDSIKNGEESLQPYKNIPLLSAGAPFKAGSIASNYVDIKAGGLAIKDLSNLYKYDNTITVIKLKGKDIKEWLEMSALMFNTIDVNSKEEQDLINRDFPTFNFDVIDGVKYEIDVTKKPKYDKNGNIINANSSRIYNLTYNDKKIDLEQEFLIATNNYRAGGNGFPWNGNQEIVYSGTYENRQALGDYIESAGKLEPTVDNNWKIKSIDTDAKVIFTSHEKGVNYLNNYPQVKVGEGIGEQLIKYNYDLSYKKLEDNKKPEIDKPEVNKPNSNNNSQTNNIDNPKTGDVSIVGYIVLGGVAVTGLVATSFKRKRK